MRNGKSGFKAFHASMSVALALGLGFFVLTSVAGVLSVGLISGYRNTTELLRQKAELVTSSEENLLRRYFGTAEEQLDFAENLVVSGEVEAGRGDEFIAMLIGSLAATPQITSLLFISPDYEMTGAERQDGEAMPLFASVREDADLRGIVDLAREQQDVWWGGLIWREEYGRAFFAFHQPLYDEDTFVGVLSALISLELLSEVISDLETEFGANAFVLYGRDQVLAHPLMAFGYPGLTKSLPIPLLGRFSDPVLASMWEERSLGIFEEHVLAGPGIHAVTIGEQDFIFLYRTVEDFSDRPLYIGTYFRSIDMLSEVFRFKWAIVFCVVISIFSALVAAYIGSEIARPVRRLAEGASRIHQLDLDSVQDIPGNFFRELDDAANSFNAMLSGLRWFERYVPKNLVKRLIKHQDDPGIETTFRDVAIMFTDIVDFTALSEGMTARETVAFLNDHFSLIAASVEGEGGTVDKYIGDGVMAIWGAPEAYSDLAERACRAALSIKKKVERYNEAWADTHGARLRVRIGLHIGRVLVGNIGSPMRINYTVIGDPVNVAERLQAMGRDIGDQESQVKILVSGALQWQLDEDFLLEHLGAHSVRGRRGKVDIYQLNGMAKDSTSEG